MEIEKKLEALLFFKGEPVTVKWLAGMLKVGEREVNKALDSLDVSLSNRGLVLVRKDDEVILGTSPESSDLIEEAQKEEIAKEKEKLKKDIQKKAKKNLN